MASSVEGDASELPQSEKGGVEKKTFKHSKRAARFVFLLVFVVHLNSRNSYSKENTHLHTHTHLQTEISS